MTETVLSAKTTLQRREEFFRPVYGVPFRVIAFSQLNEVWVSKIEVGVMP
jgi:hypothetical protein